MNTPQRLQDIKAAIATGQPWNIVTIMFNTSGQEAIVVYGITEHHLLLAYVDGETDVGKLSKLAKMLEQRISSLEEQASQIENGIGPSTRSVKLRTSVRNVKMTYRTISLRLISFTQAA